MWLLFLLFLLVAGFPQASIAAEGHLALEAGRYLVARRQLRDRWFGQTVVVIAEHGPGGTIGFIVNRPTRLQLGDAMQGLGEAAGERPLFFGGPVGLRRLAMLSTKSLPSGTAIASGLYFSAEETDLRARLSEDPANARVLLGHAGWAPGQLGAEIARGDWYVVDLGAELLFQTPAEALWESVIDRLDRPRNLAGRGWGGNFRQRCALRASESTRASGSARAAASPGRASLPPRTARSGWSAGSAP